MKNKKLLPLLMLSTAALLIFTGCSSLQNSVQKTSATTNSVSSVPQSKTDSNITVNIGVQQSLGALWIAKEKGWFENAFAKVGVKVHWIEFQSGPPYFQAVASNNLDFGQVGNTPVLVGQAAGVDFKEIAANVSKGSIGDTILVPKGSPIHSVRDLKGKKIAVAKGSSAYNTLYLALSQNGLTASDVNIIQLQPNEAEPAFNAHKVDAWAIWDPFTQVETLQHGATILTTDAKLGTVPAGFTFVRSTFAAEHPDLVTLWLKTYQQALDWELSHLDEATAIFASERHLDQNVVKAVLTDGKPETDPITPDIIKQQQETADFLYKNGGVPKQLDVSKVVDNSFIDQVSKGKN